MLYRDTSDDYIIAADPTNTEELEDVRFHLNCSPLDELKRMLEETYRAWQRAKMQGYHHAPVRCGLTEVLVELRVRGWEVDYQGTPYRATAVHAVPGLFPCAQHRQQERLTTMDAAHLQHLCRKSLNSNQRQQRLY